MNISATNSYNSSEPTIWTFTTDPYKEAYHQWCKVFSFETEESLVGRVSHIPLALVLSIPILNIICHLALLYFSSEREVDVSPTSTPNSVLIEKRSRDSLRKNQTEGLPQTNELTEEESQLQPPFLEIDNSTAKIRLLLSLDELEQKKR